MSAPPADVDPALGSPEPPAGEVTRQLRAAHSGDATARDALYSRLYEELRRLAHRVRAGRGGVARA